MKAESKTIKHFFFDEEATEKTEKVFEVSYVVIPLLPEDQRDSFTKYNRENECPLVPEESIYQWNCAYYNDYENWYETWNKA